jgi:LPS-assembly lipoprotein
MSTRRQLFQGLVLLPLVLSALALAGCGFGLRRPPHFVFTKLFIAGQVNAPFGVELRRELHRVAGLEVITDPRELGNAELILDLNAAVREKVILGRTSTGDIREFQLRYKVLFQVRNQEGFEKISDAEMVQKRDVSFSETVVLAKEMEEELLYQNMQTDLVYQLIRRLGSIQAVH